MKVRDTSGRVGGRIGGPEVDENPTRRPTESTTLNSWEFCESESPIKEHTQARIRPPGIYEPDRQFSLNGYPV